MTSNDKDDEDREWEILQRAVERKEELHLGAELNTLRIHLVIAHDVKGNRDCKYTDKSHWNAELNAIARKLDKIGKDREELLERLKSEEPIEDIIEELEAEEKSA